MSNALFFLSEDRGSVEEEERRRMQVVEKFQTAPFEEIAAHCGARVRGLIYRVLFFVAKQHL